MSLIFPGFFSLDWFKASAGEKWTRVKVENSIFGGKTVPEHNILTKYLLKKYSTLTSLNYFSLERVTV